MYRSQPPTRYAPPLDRNPSQTGYRAPGAPSYGRPQQNPGPYQTSYQHQPTSYEQELHQWFNTVDADRSGQITVKELQAALVNGNWTRFDLDTVKMLMNIFDTDHSGTIGFQEFAGLWKYISDWQNVFKHFDRDHSGSIDRHELGQAFVSFGYKLSPALLSLVEQKYASGLSVEYGQSPGISFDRFVRACVVVKTLTEAFRDLDTDRDGWIQINYEHFMKIVLSAP